MATVQPVNQQQVISQQMYNPSVKDSRWLTLEVCREYQRSKCSRSENECKFAHPPAHVEVQNGRVTCCFDSIKGKCQRKDPPCKYLHPPQHLKEQLLQNGRNNLIMRNLQMQLAASGISPMAVPNAMYPLAHPYLVQQPGYGPVPGMTGLVPGLESTGSTPVTMTGAPTAPTVQGMIPTTLSQQAKLARPDRLETSSSSNGSDPSTWTGSHPESITPVSQYSPVYFQPQLVEVFSGPGKKRPRDPADDLVLNHQVNTVPAGMVPIVKRTALDNKSGMPMYQPTTPGAAYQQAALAMQLQQQQFAPVTHYRSSFQDFVTSHPASMQRF